MKKSYTLNVRFTESEMQDIKSKYEQYGYKNKVADLKKKYIAIDKLVKMLKQRSQHSAKYKEYQQRSAFTQKSFRKKNAAAIDSYE